MTHKRRRMMKITARYAALLMLPLITAATVKGVISLKNVLSGTNSFFTAQTPSAAVSTDKQEKTKVYSQENNDDDTDTEIDPDDILYSSMILSQGYGVNAISAKTPVLSLQSPLDMTSSDPGAKPYPAEDQWQTGGEIIRTTYTPYSGTTFFDLDNGGQVNNKTDISNDVLLKESRMPADFTIESTSQPQVLIYHTHTTESFEPYVRENYDASFNYRTTDETRNMIMVGDAIQAELEARGIGVIHVRDIHDYPSYNGSYSRSRETILPILEQYPSIKVALDIHRDAISGEGFAYQPYIETEGREAAQIMIISGCDDGTLGMPSFMKNFHFACRLQEKLEGDVPGFTRPVLFDYRHYNQDLTTGSLLIEVGSHGNTLDQVQYSGQLIGRSLGDMLNDMKED